MTCSACGEHPKINTARDFTKAVIEIDNGPEAITLLRKVVIPTSMGDDTDVPAAIGKYHNVILYYEANKHVYIYSSDGIPTLLEAEVSAEVMNKIDTLEVNLDKETKDRKDEDEALDTRLTAVEGIAATAVQPADINRVVMTDTSVDSTVTSTVQIKESKVNLSTGTTSTDNLVLPVASHDQAGVMNSSIYDAVATNSSNISAILGGAVAINGLSASPSQSDLTTAWENETGLTTLINRASIFDVDNSKVWTYYSNDTTWYASSSSSQVTVSPFTNNSAGIILGSTSTGQVFAESNGTGSVNGWDTLSGAVSTNSSDISDIQLAISGKLIADPVGVGSTVSTPSNVAYVGTNNIIDGAVTAAKIDSTSLGYQTGDTTEIGNPLGVSNIDYVILPGLMTSSRTEIVFSVTFPQTLENISTVSLTSSKVYIRHVTGGYLANGVDLVSQADSISIGIVSDNTITISAVKGDAWSSTVANNTPVVVEGGFEFSFS